MTHPHPGGRQPQLSDPCPLEAGTRLMLVSMENDPDPIPFGSFGTVTGGNGQQIWVQWDDRRSLILLVGIDRYEVVDPRPAPVTPAPLGPLVEMPPTRAATNTTPHEFIQFGAGPYQDSCTDCRFDRYHDIHPDEPDEPPGAGADPYGRTAEDWAHHAE